MKNKHILYLVVISAILMIIITTAGDASTYITFKEAKQVLNKDIHIIGSLKRNKIGKIIGIKSLNNKLSFSFIMVDSNGDSEKIYYNEPMPIDFIKSEQIVIIGSYSKSKFIAKKILMKCPSKYQEEIN
jgi:cytochrome c-type biogenesis protein CcmE